MLQAMDSGHDEAAYMFGILTVEYNNSAVEVEEALVHVDKFITLSLANPMIWQWIDSVHYDALLMLIRYENLGWGVDSFILCRTSHNAILCCAKRWSIGTCERVRGGWLRVAGHAGGDKSTRMFVATFKSSYFGRNDWKPHVRELDEE
jgi:hypothetical protein